MRLADIMGRAAEWRVTAGRREVARWECSLHQSPPAQHIPAADSREIFRKSLTPRGWHARQRDYEQEETRKSAWLRDELKPGAEADESLFLPLDAAALLKQAKARRKTHVG
jgi:hypothetical protein